MSLSVHLKTVLIGKLEQEGGGIFFAQYSSMEHPSCLFLRVGDSSRAIILFFKIKL